MNNKNPFSIIPVDSSKESIKVWDFRAFDIEHNEGRIRILAVVPKKPAPLDNIRFSLAYCSPLDLQKFTRKTSNNILAGRWMAAFGPEGGGFIKHTGVISVDSLDKFAFNVISSFGDSRPYWVETIEG